MRKQRGVRRTLEDLNKTHLGGVPMYHVSCEIEVYNQLAGNLWIPTPNWLLYPGRNL